MKNKIILSILVSLLFITLMSFVESTTCYTDGQIKCLSTSKLQVCTDWDGTGMQWGWCPGSEYGSQCIGKSLSLTLGTAVTEFGFSPQPPSSLWSEQEGCTGGVHYEAKCISASITVSRDECADGCDGDECADADINCEVGESKCSSDRTSKATCLNTGSGGSDWGEYISCGEGYKCDDSDSLNVQCIPKKEFNWTQLIVISVIILLVILIAFNFYKYFKKGRR